MRLYSFVCLLFVFVVLIDSVTCYPTATDPADSANAKRHSSPAKKHRTSKHHHRHSSRGLKEVTDYDVGLPDKSSTLAADMEATGSGKLRRIGAPKTEERRKNRQGKKKKNKRSGKNKNKKSTGDRKLAASLRTARRADPDGPLYDAEDSKQLLGLGVFGDMRKFFHELRTNLDAEDAAAAIAESGRVKEQDPSVASLTDPGFEEYEELPNFQALRTIDFGQDREYQQRRQSGSRGFVSMPSESSRHHRARQFNPELLWTGLGR